MTPERSRPRIGLLPLAYKIPEKVLGPDQPDTASSLNDLGLPERALAIREKVLGPDAPTPSRRRLQEMSRETDRSLEGVEYPTLAPHHPPRPEPSVPLA